MAGGAGRGGRRRGAGCPAVSLLDVTVSSIISPGLLAIALALPATAAAAPTVDVEKPCWNSRSSIDVAGTGYRKSVGFKLLVNGKVLVRGTTTTTGDIAGGIRLPRVTRANGQRTFVLRLTDGRRSATTRIYATAIWADYEPAVSSLKQRVTFFGNGFGPRKTVFLHYLSPKGKVRRTVRLGRTVGVCGSLQQPGRRVFPFIPEAGRWRLQFDTRVRYVRGPRPSVVLAITIVKRRSSTSGTTR